MVILVEIIIIYLQEGDSIRVNTQSTVKSANELFAPGVAQECKTMDGRKVMVNIQFYSNYYVSRDERTKFKLHISVDYIYEI